MDFLCWTINCNFNSRVFFKITPTLVINILCHGGLNKHIRNGVEKYPDQVGLRRACSEHPQHGHAEDDPTVEKFAAQTLNGSTAD